MPRERRSFPSSSTATPPSRARASSPNASASPACRGYGTGGTLHFIINNQVGFTTSPQFARSSPYPSDLAKAVQAPVLHVNGDDPEAVTFACKLAIEYRQRFKRDIVIDMWCYRRFGHNEGDEPSFTQPLMYAEIRKHAPISELYGERLIGEGVIEQGWIDQHVATFTATARPRIRGCALLPSEQGGLVRRPLDRPRPSGQPGIRPPQRRDCRRPKRRCGRSAIC